MNDTVGDADVPSALVTFGVPTFTHTVPSDATAFVTPSPTASASAPTALSAAPPTTSPTAARRCAERVELRSRHQAPLHGNVAAEVLEPFERRTAVGSVAMTAFQSPRSHRSDSAMCA